MSVKNTQKAFRCSIILTGYFPSISVGCAAHGVFTRTDKLLFGVISDRALLKQRHPQALRMEAADSRWWSFHVPVLLCRLHSLSPSVFEADVKVKVSPGRYRLKPVRFSVRSAAPPPSITRLFFFFFLGLLCLKTEASFGRCFPLISISIWCRLSQTWQADKMKYWSGSILLWGESKRCSSSIRERSRWWVFFSFLQEGDK